MLCAYGRNSFEDLQSIPVPKDTNSYKAVPHDVLVQRLEEVFNDTGYIVAERSFGLAKKGQQLFGVMYLKDTSQGAYGYAVGFRNSYDKSLALGLVGGTRVFVCSNLCFSGDVMYLRKHTSGLDLDKAISEVLPVLTKQINLVANRLEDLKAIKAEGLELKGSVVRLAENGVIPYSDIRKVLDDIYYGTHFPNDRNNEYGVVMAATNIMKKYNPARQTRSFQKLSYIYSL